MLGNSTFISGFRVSLDKVILEGSADSDQVAAAEFMKAEAEKRGLNKCVIGGPPETCNGPCAWVYAANRKSGAPGIPIGQDFSKKRGQNVPEGADLEAIQGNPASNNTAAAMMKLSESSQILTEQHRNNTEAAPRTTSSPPMTSTLRLCRSIQFQ